MNGWFRQVPIETFLPHFEDWTWDWLDVPALIRDAEGAFENPMIDRDPVPTWVEGPVALLGDAAHAMYPTGSNGAGQAIIDARVLGAALCEHGVTARALAAYNERCVAATLMISTPLFPKRNARRSWRNTKRRLDLPWRR